MKLSIVVAMSENRVIGKDGKIPWHLPEDLKHFREITLDHHVLMGRKTYESVGKPLPGRTNLVLTRDKNFNREGIIIFQDFGDAYNFALARKEKELMVIGGEKVFAFALPLAEKIYMTLIKKEFDGDTKFPEQDINKWVETSSELHSNGMVYHFRTLERR